MKKKPHDPKITAEDIELFRNSIKKITTITSDKKLLRKPRLAKKTIRLEVQPEPYFEEQYENFVDAEQKLFFAKNGLSEKRLRRLKQGKIPVTATLDLHGFTAEQAKKEIVAFIERAIHRNDRCICIIHGKGHSDKPVLKNGVNHWLKQLDSVLAFATTIPSHGGTGALYVLLKCPTLKK